MKRRDFLLRSSGALALPLVINGMPLKAYTDTTLQQLFGTESDRVLVLVQLAGGNDGINTVLPLDAYADYMSVRTNIAIPESKALKLTDATGLHPIMPGIQNMYKDGKVRVVQGVTYPNPNLSHFRSTDIWMTGTDSNVVNSTGWLGRFLEKTWPAYPTGYPNASMPDPIAIQIAPVVALALTNTHNTSMGIALQDPTTFYNLVNGTVLGDTDLPSERYAKLNVQYVREVQSQSLQYSQVIKAAADKAKNFATYPTGNTLAVQLAIVARLIAGGLKTKVYVVQLGGFDTHSAQVVSTDPTTGNHATLLQRVSEALTAFQTDLEELNVDDRVVTMSFSEFGRRVHSNLSDGTDHGTAAPMFFVGTPVINGVLGVNPSLTDLDNDNLKMQYDFRQIYASVLEQWFGADPAVLRDVLFKDFTTVPIIKTKPTGVQEVSADAAYSLGIAHPNPVRESTTIPYTVRASSRVKVQVFDQMGLLVSTLVDDDLALGDYQARFTASGLPSGSYTVQLRAGGERRTQTVVVTR